jgi:hypothetical protein
MFLRHFLVVFVCARIPVVRVCDVSQRKEGVAGAAGGVVANFALSRLFSVAVSFCAFSACRLACVRVCVCVYVCVCYLGGLGLFLLHHQHGLVL